MAKAKSVIVERHRHLLLITINRPEARNAINREVHLGIGMALEEAQADPEIRAVIVTGQGDLAFCAGADLKALAAGQAIVPDDPVAAAWGFAGYVAHSISKPTIAAVNGTALGGGTEIVLASDLAIAAQGAVFGQPEVKRGIIAAAGGAFRLGLQVPRKIAMEILLTGAPITAERALEIGLINRVVPAASLLDEAMALGRAIAENAPLAVQATKRVALGIGADGIAGEDCYWTHSALARATVMSSEDAREGMRAFAEKRSPVWRAR